MSVAQLAVQLIPRAEIFSSYLVISILRYDIIESLSGEAKRQVKHNKE